MLSNQEIKNWQRLLSLCESPIEYCLAQGISQHLGQYYVPGFRFNEQEIFDAEKNGRVIVFAQYKILKYRVDFLFCGYGNRVIVECDGLDFHRDRALEDFERDQELRRHGFRTHRFPGGRIYRDLMEVMALIDRSLRGLVAQ